MSLLGLQRQGQGPLLVWLHGFTQTRDSALNFRTILAGTFEVMTIDLPGHGQNANVAATLDETADLLADVLPPEPFILGGYSFGARTALHFALRHRERLQRLVVLGATRGIESESERLERRQRDEVLAERIEEIGTEFFLEEWLAQPMFQRLPSDPAERAARSRDAHGLAQSLRLAGTGTQRWLEPELTSLDLPTLTIAGQLDAKFTTEALAIAAALPLGHAHVVSAAGHASHIEQPRATAELIIAFQPR